MFVLLGPGANGKDVLLSVLENIVGSENVSHMEFNELKVQRFSKAELCGKLVNICTELSRKMPADLMKALVGGATVKAEKKNKDPFEFKNTARFAVACNELPETKDKTHGYWRKLVIIPFNRIFREDEQDLHLTEKLIKESDGIFMWALEGLKRLRKQGRLTKPKGSVKALEDYKLEQDHIVQFIKDKCKPDPEGTLTTTDIHREYKTWCVVNGLTPDSLKKFGSELNRLGIEKWGSGGTFRKLKIKYK